jgi:tryptophan synthase alpha subunit
MGRVHLAPIFLAAPTSPDERLQAIATHSKGFVYAISRVGITGTQQTMTSDAASLVARIKRWTKLPVAVGFGISNAEHVAQVAQFADAAVIGSAIVQLIERSTPATAPDLSRACTCLRRRRPVKRKALRGRCSHGTADRIQSIQLLLPCFRAQALLYAGLCPGCTTRIK